MPATVHKFADFELDPARFQLRRGGRVLKLERIPMELLLFLLEKRGDVATRQEIVERLWGKHVFVDTEHGINTAVRKIRSVLRDDPEQPRFVQTVTGKGYRFVADYGEFPAAVPEIPASTSAPVSQPSPSLAPPVTLGPALLKRWLPIAALCALLSAAGLLAINAAGVRDRLFRTERAPQIHSLAVLPLANLSGDVSQEYFADGMTDEVITMLAKNTSLRVISRTSAMRYKGVSRPLAEIAHELGVDGVLEGSVSRSSNRVHLTVQLIHAPSDTHIWAESYDRDLNQAMSLPTELSQSIASQVRVADSPSTPQRYINPEAHDAYLRGRYFWFAGNDQRSQELFEKAIQIQPDYAAAWAGLASSYQLRPIDDECPAREVMPQIDVAVHKALELDPSLPEAHHAMAAWYLFFIWDLPRADAESRRAIELDPNISEQHHLRSYILFAMNRNDEALHEQKLATELDPFARPWALGRAYLLLRQFDPAIAELRLSAEATPNQAGIHSVLAEAYWSKHMWNEWAKEFETAYEVAGEHAKATAAQHAFQRGGARSLAQWHIDVLKAQIGKAYVSPLVMARRYAYLGDKENTLKFLEQSYRDHHPWLVLLRTEPEFDFVHADARYQALLQKIGLPR